MARHRIGYVPDLPYEFGGRLGRLINCSWWRVTLLSLRQRYWRVAEFKFLLALFEIEAPKF